MAETHLMHLLTFLISEREGHRWELDPSSPPQHLLWISCDSVHWFAISTMALGEKACFHLLLTEGKLSSREPRLPPLTQDDSVRHLTWRLD